PGRNFDEVIEEALGQSKSVVVLWSKASVSSDWVRAEASEGREREILVPVFIEEVKVPLVYKRLQAARLASWNGEMPHQEVDKLIRAIGAILGHPGLEEKREKKKTAATPKKEENKKEKKRPVVTRKSGGEEQEQDKAQEIKPSKFRSTPKEEFSKESVSVMLKQHNFFCTKSWLLGTGKYANPNGGGFDNKFEKQNNGQIVCDYASGLTWQQSGSDESMTYKEATAYITKLNGDQFAGRNDWRLPTLEEAMSLMESEKKNGDLYIDPIFDKRKQWIWTSDQASASVAWVVNFVDGNCFGSTFDGNDFVRAVR
ncbi:MAG: DUF1566 domain-containing protein, partial [Candidatus Scalindua sp.]|nr:DUF1566 domain-containing protein [Candidatus Scalindua sp.]